MRKIWVAKLIFYLWPKLAVARPLSKSPQLCAQEVLGSKYRFCGQEEPQLLKHWYSHLNLHQYWRHWVWFWNAKLTTYISDYLMYFSSMTRKLKKINAKLQLAILQRGNSIILMPHHSDFTWNQLRHLKTVILIVLDFLNFSFSKK